LMGRLKGFGHGWKQAFTPSAAACEGCAKCVEACPESAIRLVRGETST
jgi:ferredoxin